MSAATAPSPLLDHLDFVRAWARNLAELLSQPVGMPLACEVLSRIPENAAARSESDLWLTATLTGALSGELGFRMAPADARRLAQRYEGKAEGSDEAIGQDAVLKLFDKTAALVSTQLKTSGKDVQFQVAFGTPPSWTPSATYYMQASLTTQAMVEVLLNEALITSLQIIPVRPDVSPVAGDPAISKLGMFMDVELVVTMRFGGRRMLLKDILDLCTGSVVELDQRVQEPVDLLLDGKLIARGEVVVVDGNYGLRITELFSKRD
jgi:flagellar motor switch protein FliN/FliY